MEVRWTKLMAAAILAAVFTMAGCSGDDGDNGTDGAAGAPGDPGTACWDLNANGVGDLPDEDLNGDGVVDTFDCNALANPGIAEVAASKPESCSTCHGEAGVDHQAVYDRYVDNSDLTLEFDQGDVSSADNGDGTFTVTLTFTVTKFGQPLNDPTLGSLDQKRFYAVEYFEADQEYLNSCSLGTLAAVDAPNGVYSATDDNCGYAPEASNAHVYGYVADDPLFIHDGGAGAEIPVGSHVHLYDNEMNTAVAFGTADVNNVDAYVSAANVSGCEKCHGTPYLKHGYRAAEVDNLPDFAACKSCHYDDRNGGHADWQYMVDDPYAWATGEAPTADYAYIANVMNDTHMSHAMEFPYPMSMSNCASCHEGKLDVVTADDEFTAETCQSCHAVQGVDAWPEYDGQPEGKYYQEARAVPLDYIWAEAGVGFHTVDLDCQLCHTAAGGATQFDEIHTGYDPRISDPSGNKYADQYTVSIDSISVAGDLMTIEFSSNDVAIIPEVTVSFYGYDTKDMLVSSHTRGADRVRMEYVPESSGGSANPLFTENAGSGPGAWSVTLDFAAYQAVATPSIPDLIADGDIKNAEIAVMPELNLNGVDVGLNAASQTFDIGENLNVDNYYKGTNAIVDVDKCNVCHDELAVTFHSGSGRGGDITTCRTCHVTTNGGSHLEMQSRSLDSYIHATHTFQAFDTDDIFEEYDPVFSKRYSQHITHVFPNFTISNCEACHVSGSVTYNVPDQSKSMPGLLSSSYDVATWYGLYGVDAPAPTPNLDGLAYEEAGRNIGTVPEYVTGPASRACGGCHRARLINEDAAGALASWNSHTESFGTYSENDEDDEVLYGVIDKIMSMFQ